MSGRKFFHVESLYVNVGVSYKAKDVLAQGGLVGDIAFGHSGFQLGTQDIEGRAGDPALPLNTQGFSFVS